MAELTRDQMIAMLAALQEENQALKEKQAQRQRITMKVSEKGAMSLYGLGRWPVTLYKSQWQALLAHTKAVETFLADNAALLKDKPSA